MIVRVPQHHVTSPVLWPDSSDTAVQNPRAAQEKLKSDLTLAYAYSQLKVPFQSFKYPQSVSRRKLRISPGFPRNVFKS